MDYEALYEAIFHRRSVRKYDSAPLPDETIAELAEVIEKLIPLRPEIQTDIRILGPGDIRTNAPHCICVYSEKKEGHRMNAGFLAEMCIRDRDGITRSRSLFRRK